MNSIKKFNTDIFIDALKAFFEELKIPVDYISNDPVLPQDLLGDLFIEDDDTHKLIDKLYLLGIVNNAIFEGTNTFNNVDDVKKLSSDYDGLLIFGVDIKQRENGLKITRSQFAEITRLINRVFPYMPVTVIFKCGKYISLANSERSKYKQAWREGDKLGKVTILKDVDTEHPHAAHLRILSELAINTEKINSFQSLYNYWQVKFSVQALNDQFYSDLQDWFYYATQKISLPYKPDYIDNNENIKNFLVRLVARIMFCWFVKEKGLIRKELLELTDWQGNRYKLTNDVAERNFLKSNSYYRGILQNVFFNALNKKEKNSKRDYGWTTYWHSELDIDCFNEIPYLNGGIFDKLDEDNARESIEDSVIKIPNYLFYGIEEKEAVRVGRGASATTQMQKVEHKGLNEILKSYKFTLDENTPFEEDIALDPEMLGLVFENLLAELDPNLEQSTISSIRKLTGSYYTPRKVIFEMVNDSLYLYICKFIEENYPDIQNVKQQVNSLIYYNNKSENNDCFDKAVVDALDKFRMLDPACGSGAFPMGMLHRIVDILKIVDADNKKWIELKLNKVDDSQKVEFKKVLTEHLDDYSRKLGIIKDTIYGIDIQPLAVQITKLRFFISLLIDQNPRKCITPMPNIETKIICADSLKNVQADLFSEDAIEKLTIARNRFYQPDISVEEKHEISDEIVTILDIAFPSFARLTTGKNIQGQNKELIRHWFNHGTIAAPFFNMDFFFPELKEHGGFDCVIGNPPYGGTKISDEVRNALMIDSRDPYGAFIARFLNDYTIPTPLKHGGVLAFIVSDTFMTIKSHLKLRKLLMHNYVHKMLRVHPDTFKATVNTVIMIAERNTSSTMNENHICLMGDLTNISIHENYNRFSEVLNLTKGVDFENEDSLQNISNEEYALYFYPQKLIKTNSNLPFFVASPKLFALMNDSGTDLKTENTEIDGDTVLVRKIQLNGKEIKVVKLGDIADTPQGIATGDAHRYIRKHESVRDSYENVDLDKVIQLEELALITDKERLNGIDYKKFKGKYFVPYDKGGTSDIGTGYLPKYYVPLGYYIDWSENSVKRMKTITIGEKKVEKGQQPSQEDFSKIASRVQNLQFGFRDGLTYSMTGEYAPTFRQGFGGLFDVKSPMIFSSYSNRLLLGILNSKFIKFIAKNYINHGVDFSNDPLKEIAIILHLNEKLKIELTVNMLIKKQYIETFYDYASHEQLEIDKLVNEAYGLNAEDVEEVENWYARRYPKLSDAQKANLRALGKSDDYLKLYGLR